MKIIIKENDDQEKEEVMVIKERPRKGAFNYMTKNLPPSLPKAQEGLTLSFEKLLHDISKDKVTFSPKKYLTLTKASEVTGVSTATLRRWVYTYKIGTNIHGVFHIDPHRLKTLLEEIHSIKGSFLDSSTRKNCVCPHGYVFGSDYDKKERCSRCHPIIWMRCADLHDKQMYAQTATNKVTKIYNKMDLDKKIEEMEKHLE